MPPVFMMIKPSSGLCNMNCKYCFYADEMRNRNQASYGFMSLETLECLVRRVMDYADSQCTLAFQGGEPTLVGLDFYKKLFELEAKYNQKHLTIQHTLQTNGLGLDDEWCRFLAKHHFLVGLSVDGMKATHDAYRKDTAGGDTYFSVLSAAERLQKANVDFNVLTVVNAKTAPKIRRIYEQYRKLGFHWQQYIACLDPIGARHGQQEYSLTAQTYGQFLIDLFDLWEMDLRHGQQPFIRQFENYISILMGYPPESCEQTGICTCQNVVEADGSVYPCDFYVLDEYRIGNIQEDDLDMIARKSQKSGFVEKSLPHSKKCRECPYYFICRSGCRRHKELPGGENEFCEAYQMFFDACLPRMQAIARAMRRTPAFSNPS